MLSVRVPESIFQAITKKAEETNSVVSDYVRNILLKGINGSLKNPDNPDEVLELKTRLEKANRELKSFGFKPY